MKIIDYGRCHFNHTVNGQPENTKIIVDTLCADRDRANHTQDPCYGIKNGSKDYCGQYYGMASVFGENEFNSFRNNYSRVAGSFDYVNPATKNVSHDLRLLHTVNKYILKNFTIKYKDDNGTPEDETVTYDNTTPLNTPIKNVSEAIIALKKYTIGWTLAKFIEWTTGTPSPQAKYNKYGASSGWQKMGDFHIYEDQRNYKFIPTTS
jgi:hypothetical protein